VLVNLLKIVLLMTVAPKTTVSVVGVAACAAEEDAPPA